MRLLQIQVVVSCFALIFTGAASETERSNRIKRQNAGDRVIDAVFQIPIQTLTAVGTLVKTSRPIIMQIRQQIQQSMTPRGGHGHPHRFSFPAAQQGAAAAPQGGANRRQDQRTPTSNFNRLPH